MLNKSRRRIKDDNVIAKQFSGAMKQLYNEKIFSLFQRYEEEDRISRIYKFFLGKHIAITELDRETVIIPMGRLIRVGVGQNLDLHGRSAYFVYLLIFYADTGETTSFCMEHKAFHMKYNAE